ncbi:hypothetical protein IHE45_05G112900 [Dioscorea alata]|uniref:Uncharacterized protein n=1 Tax=Dioscorea alata TaxID=55571 RepID=A0ACB7W3X8_DIOAL|nr:hypothetical protein IHE45_05G112900 [Dioscorea alata]
MQESIWRFAYLRDLQVPLPLRPPPFHWSNLYASTFDGSHSYKFRQRERHIDWMRIGAFFFDSPAALLMETLALPRKIPEAGQDPQKSVMASGAFVLTNIRTGIWIADLQLVRCPVCNLNTCEGTMQILDTRAAELFLEEGYQSGSWDYVEIASHKIEKHSSSATGAIFDLKHLHSPHSVGVLDVKSWMGKADDWQPKASICLNAVAVNTNLQHNDGLHVRFEVMRSGGSDGDVVSIRISQQLI